MRGTMHDVRMVFWLFVVPQSHSYIIELQQIAKEKKKLTTVHWIRVIKMCWNYRTTIIQYLLTL